MTSRPDDAPSLERLRADYGVLLARLEASDRRFRGLARSVFRVQEDERRRIARELHDGIGQNLTALKHQLALLTAEAPDPALQAGLDAAVELCAQTLADTRELSRLLRPQVLDDLGLDAALRWLGRVVGEKAGLAVTVTVDADVPALDDELQTLFFRIAQESLTNVVRHAGAREAAIALGVRGGQAVLTVWDDGRGFDVDAALAGASAGVSSSLGGMRDRVALHGGRLRIDSDGDGGTRLHASVPLDDGAPR
jgi:signal transduction histidine kinase